MAAAAIGMASTIPAQPATLRGSAVSKAIGEDFVKNVIAKAAEDSLEPSDTNELTAVLSSAGMKTFEGLIMQAGIAGATLAGKAIVRSCQRRRPGEPEQPGDKSKMADQNKELTEAKEAIKKFKQEYGKSPKPEDLATPTKPTDQETPSHGPSFHNMFSNDETSENCSLDMAEIDLLHMDETRVMKTQQWLEKMQGDNKKPDENTETLKNQIKRMESRHQETQNVLEDILKQLEANKRSDSLGAGMQGETTQEPILPEPSRPVGSPYHWREESIAHDQLTAKHKDKICEAIKST